MQARDFALFCLTSLLLGLASSEATAENVLSSGNAQGAPGATGVVLAISLDVDTDLASIGFRVSYDTTVLDAIEYRKAGRTIVSAQAVGLDEAQERVTFAIADLSGGVAVPAGSGPIAEIVFKVPASASPGDYSVTISHINNVISTASQLVPVSSTDGMFTVTPAGLSAIVTPRPATVSGGRNALLTNDDMPYAAEATAHPGYAFNYWEESITGVVSDVGDASTTVTTVVPATVTAHFVGATPEIDVERDSAQDVHSYDFGSAEPGQTVSQLFSVRNEGAATLIVTEASGLAAPFSISPVNGGASGDDWPIAPGAAQVVVATFAPTAGGSCTDTLILSSNDVDESSYLITFTGHGAAPEIDVERDGADNVHSHSFGSVPAGQSASQSLIIRDEGTAELRVTEASGLAAPFSIWPANGSGSPDDWRIAPGGVQVFTVTYAPTSAGSYSDTLILSNNDPDEGSYLITFTGTAEVTDIDVEHDGVSDVHSHEFGVVAVGQAAADSFTISNEGAAELRVTEAAGLAAPFEIRPENGSESRDDWRIAAGGTKLFTVTFTPSGPGSYSDVLLILSTDPDEGTYPITFAGTGGAPEIDVECDGADDVHSHDFGEIVPGNSVSQAFTVRNESVAELRVTQVSGLAAPFSISPTNGSGSADDWRIGPDEIKVFTITAAPAVAGIYSGLLIISCNDPDESAYVIMVSAIGSAPEIDVERDGVGNVHAHDFGGVVIGSASSRLLTVCNKGTAELVVTQASGLGDPFSISPVNGSGVVDDWTIAPGGSAPFTVTFAPSAETSYADTLVLSNTDPDEGGYGIAFTGAGRASSSYYVNDGSTADDFWCTAAGHPSHSGLLPGEPKDSIQAILDAYDLGGGDTIHVDTGAYSVDSPIQIEASDSGSETDPVSLIGSPHPSGAVLSVGRVDGGLRIQGATGVSIQGLRLQGPLGWAARGIHVSSARHVSVLDNTLEGFLYTGIDIPGSSQVSLTGNVIRGSNFAGVRLRARSTDVTISANRIYGNGVGVLVEFSGPADLANNFIYGNRQEGVLLRGVVDDVALRHNTFHANTCAICIENSVGSIGVRNNILWADGSGNQCYAVDAPSQTALSSDRNDLYATGSAGTGDWGGLVCDGLSDWQAASAQDLHSLPVDPAVRDADSVDLQERDYHLTNRSPLINLGDPSDIETDIDGDSRTDDAAPDIGADEFVGEPDIKAKPKKLKFKVRVGRVRDRSLRIRNKGTAALVVSSITSSNPKFFLVSADLPVTVAPGASVDLTVRFAPDEVGKEKGKLTITSNDPDEPEVKVKLRGTGKP